MPTYTATTKRVWLPKRGHFAHFVHRDILRQGLPTRRFTGDLKTVASIYPNVPVSIPMGWTKGDTLSFPIDGNDTYGDCLYAAACHGDNTFTGNVGTESVFNEATIIADYLALSGGDNGLTNTMITSAWEQGLTGVPDAKIYDTLYIEPTDYAAMQAAVYLFGGFMFFLSVPDAWVQEFTTDCVWDAPATADAANGHGIWINGIGATDNFEFQSWGTHAWITEAGVAVCDPGVMVVFSPRWFNASGMAPNLLSYAQLASLWVQFGGTQPPVWTPPSPSPTPTPAPPAPPPTPTPTPPTPIPVSTTTVGIDPAGKVVYSPSGFGLRFVKATGHAVYLIEGSKQIGLPGAWTGQQVGAPAGLPVISLNLAAKIVQAPSGFKIKFSKVTGNEVTFTQGTATVGLPGAWVGQQI